MPMTKTAMSMKIWPTGALFAAGLAVIMLAAMPSSAFAQVVVVANGSPITEIDIQQRSKLIFTSTHKTPTRQEVIAELIDDRLKIAKAKVYGMEVTDSELEGAYKGMADRQHVTVAQFTQMLERSGVAPAALKARLRADLTWNNLVRGKFGPSLTVGESDVSKELQLRNVSDKPVAGYTYTLYPVTVVMPRNAPASEVELKHKEAESLRARFFNCKEGLAVARAIRDIAVREPVSRSSTDLAPQLVEMLATVEVGRLTIPELTPQGFQMYALCSKKASTSDSPVLREVRDQIFNKRFQYESNKFLEEIRKQAMIEYK